MVGIYISGLSYIHCYYIIIINKIIVNYSSPFIIWPGSLIPQAPSNLGHSLDNNASEMYVENEN